MTNATKTWKWVQVGPRERGEHRYFRDENGSPGIYIADQSGKRPDTTEDGPLRVVDGGRMQFGIWTGKDIGVMVDVWSVRDQQRYHTGVSIEGARWLLEESELTFDVRVESPSLAKVIALFRGPRATTPLVPSKES